MSDKLDDGPDFPSIPLSVPATLYRKLEAHARNAGFDSASAYATFVLREVLAEDDVGEGEASPRDDEEKIKERLRALGYLD